MIGSKVQITKLSQFPSYMRHPPLKIPLCDKKNVQKSDPKSDFFCSKISVFLQKEYLFVSKGDTFFKMDHFCLKMGHVLI